MQDLDRNLVGRILLPFLVDAEVDDRRHAVVDEGGPAASLNWRTLSARTIVPNRVSPPSSVRQAAEVADVETAVPGEVAATLQRRRARRPEVVDVAPSISTSTSVARRARPDEVDGRVAARSSAEERRIGPARALDEDLFDPADALAVPLEGDALDDVDEALDALLLHLVGDLVGDVAASVPWRGE